MHEMHCKRHISLCEHCNEPIPKNEMEVHYEENHAKIKCPKCETEVEKMHLEEHEVLYQFITLIFIINS